MALLKKKKNNQIDEFLDAANHSKSFASKVTALLGGLQQDNDEIYQQLLVLLIESDVGVEKAENIMVKLKDEVNNDFYNSRSIIIEKLKQLMIDEYVSSDYSFNDKNHLIMMVGVNGSGKTTTIAKLAKHYLDQGLTVGMIAADTFRAGAVDQLAKWAEKLEVHCITGKENADPSSVLVDGCRYYKENPVDVILADTAGRLQNKENLMNELKKMVRVTKRELEKESLDIFLSVDATTGQNGLSQAENFLASSDVNGIILTKIDSTSRGGIVLSINSKYKLPIVYCTYGESIECLKEFKIEDYVESLLTGKSYGQI